MKIDRYGQAKILTPEEIQLLFSKGFATPRSLRYLYLFKLTPN